jgi:predicted transcriptional regulator
MKTLIIASIGHELYEQIKNEIADRTMEELPKVIHYSYDYTSEALNLEETLSNAMKGLSSADFEGVLHPGTKGD